MTIGGNYPVVVQSMITEETHNVDAAVEQIIAMHQAGSEIVRVTTPNMAEARCLAEIRRSSARHTMDVPLVADVHHQGTDIAVEVAKYVDKVRINPVSSSSTSAWHGRSSTRRARSTRSWRRSRRACCR